MKKLFKALISWFKNLTDFERLAVIYVAFVLGWAIVLGISEFNNK